MVRVTAPGMSLDASGTLAGALVFSKWKGRNYIREHVIPANPRSGGQVGIRAMFKFLTQIWDGLSQATKDDWLDRAANGVYSTFNAYLSYNMRRWRNFQTPTQLDPAAEAGAHSSLDVYTATGGLRHVTLETRIDTPNDGWGGVWFRSIVTGFDSAFSNAIGVNDFTPGIVQTFVDSPLLPGTYYYLYRTMTVDGLMQVEPGQLTAVVT